MNSESGDPLSDPRWHALARESKLARQLIGSGVTALGNANYADGKGNYYVAFFALSVGIERLCKLILVADFAIENSGTLPSAAAIKKFGHRINDLLRTAESVSLKRDLKRTRPRPTGRIADAVVACLDAFADASRGRYANFSSLGDPNVENEFEPLRLWWTTVADEILKEHFRGTAQERRVRRNAQVVAAMMRPVSMVLFTAEDGTRLDDHEAASIRTGKTVVVQKYGRLYVLMVVRALAEIFYELTATEGYGGTPVVFGHYEHFTVFMNENSMLRDRKRWP
jgi:hypothetical protein